jgi:hypothetical protein
MATVQPVTNTRIRIERLGGILEAYIGRMHVSYTNYNQAVFTAESAKSAELFHESLCVLRGLGGEFFSPRYPVTISGR